MVFLLLGPTYLGAYITPLGVVGIFIAGLLYTYSFTTSIGAILLLPFIMYYPLGVIAVIGGLGSLFGDLTLFRLVRNDLHKEVQHIASSKFIRRLGVTPLIREPWFRDVIGALILASPIPDEIGIAIMATAKIETATFMLIAFMADVLGIYLLVSAAALIY